MIGGLGIKVFSTIVRYSLHLKVKVCGAGSDMYRV